MDPGSVLATIAQVAAAFVGFTGVIFAVGRFSQGGWRGPEREALVHLLLPSLVVLFMALFGLAASTGIESDVRLWRVCNGMLAVFMCPWFLERSGSLFVPMWSSRSRFGSC